MPDWSPINRDLFIGSAPRSRKDFDELAAHGITAILSLLTDDDIIKDGLRWEQIEHWSSMVGIDARRVPIQDHSPEAVIAKLKGAVMALRMLHAEGHTVYLHCSAGINRSPTIAVAYLVKAKGLSVNEALDIVKTARPSMQPYQQALAQLEADQEA